MNLSAVGAALALLFPLPVQDDPTPLPLHNGLDVLWVIQAPYQGAPVSSFDPTGDLYWKAFPADALRRCDGTSDLMGIRAVTFDTDPVSSETLWAYTVTKGTTGTDGTILPTFTGSGVFVPGLSTTGSILFNASICQAGGTSGYVGGWVYNEVFLDTLGMPTPLLELTADGTTDWVFTHYFPAPGFADNDLAHGPINSCGGTGDATLQWGGSIDGQPTPLSLGGENQPDWTGLGNSIYGGFNVGGAGAFAPIPEGPDGGAELEWLFDEPVVTVRADTDNGDGFGKPEVGLAALQTPLQISSGGVPGPGTTRIGVRLYAQDAAPTHVMIASVNVGPTLHDLGAGCLDFAGGRTGLNPADPAFVGGLLALGIGTFGQKPWDPWWWWAEGTYDHGGTTVPSSVFDTLANSALLPAGTGPAWIDLALSWQAWQYDTVSGTVVGSSQVFRQMLRTNDGLP